VSEFVDEDGVEFAWIKHTVDADGEQDAREENAADSRTGVTAAESDGDTVGQKIGCLWVVRSDRSSEDE
jgi:hypothetical protein